MQEIFGVTAERGSRDADGEWGRLESRRRIWEYIKKCGKESAWFVALGIYVGTGGSIRVAEIPGGQTVQYPCMFIAPDRCDRTGQDVSATMQSLSLNPGESFKAVFAQVYFHELAHRVMDAGSLRGTAPRFTANSDEFWVQTIEE